MDKSSIRFVQGLITPLACRAFTFLLCSLYLYRALIRYVTGTCMTVTSKKGRECSDEDIEKLGDDAWQKSQNNEKDGSWLMVKPVWELFDNNLGLELMGGIIEARA